MLTGPINSVILSYISRWNHNKKNLLNKVLLLGVVVVILGYIITLLISKPIIGILFPQWQEEVLYYMPVTTVTVLLLALISIIQPFILKFCEMKWQIVINSIGVVIYFSCSLIFWKMFGLMGFCVGTAVGTLSKLIIMLVVYYKYK